MMKKTETSDDRDGSGILMKYGMWACCAIMIAPVALYFAAGGLSGGIANNAIILAPLAVCMGAHFLMHRFTGKSCHDDTGPEHSETAENHATARHRIASD